MKKLLLITGALIFLVAISGWAQIQRDGPLENGEWLHDLWMDYQKAETHDVSDDPNALEIVKHWGMYSGYVNGAGAVIAREGIVSVPRSVNSAHQLSAVVGLYLDSHPEEWNLPAETVVTKAMKNAWSK